MYKILGAVAIIGLFVLGSMSTGLGADVQQQPVIALKKTQDQQIIEGQQMLPGIEGEQLLPPGYQEPPEELLDWDGVGDLPYYDGDGQDGGLFYGNSYPLPEGIAENFPSYYSVDFDPTGLDFNNPQYVVYTIAIQRENYGIFRKTSTFKVLIGNIGAPDFHPLQWFKTRVRVFHIIPHVYEESKKCIIVPAIGLRVITTPEITTNMLGSTVMANPNYNNVPQMQFPYLFRLRRFVSHWICPFSTIGYGLMVDVDDWTP